ncbi:MAG TPA: ABC transporter permease [Bradyrhizobium sp.]|uniref:ABC transporter permease n=1 Tax=Bradyrhizobium sp. TaxID=376 RepID=UPI002C4A4203|nr:ABC transporter permease [Bradyrhizobium sp.]HLZ00976.1 ABC transporter permease [Bradyrhizobium sp.]
MSSPASPIQLVSSTDDTAASPADNAERPRQVAHEEHAEHDDAPPPSATRESRRERLEAAAKSWSISIASVVVGVLLWHLATKNSIEWYIRFSNVPSPLQVGQAFWAHLRETTFYLHILVSMRRILYAYGLATGLGVLIGLVMGRSKLARDILMPYLEILRPIPAVAWIPLAILMMPTEESSIIYITFLGALFPIILNTIHGVEQTPEVLIRAARTLGANRLEVFWYVVIPAALPSIAAGLAIGMGVAWFSLLAGEIISGQYGIGYFTWNAYSLINYPDIVVGMFAIGALGTFSTYGVRLLTRPFLAWQRRTR